MPKEQINTPALRTIIPMKEPDGTPSTSWAQGWYDPMSTLEVGTTVEPTAVLLIGWDHGAVGSESPDGASMQFLMQISADEVLRKADDIKARRERERPQPAEVIDGEVIDGTAEVITFRSVVITRPEVQKLIAVARRARNAVHGADE